MKGKKYLKNHAKEDCKMLLAESSNLIKILESKLIQEQQSFAMRSKTGLFYKIPGLIVSALILISISIFIFCPLNSSQKYHEENFLYCETDLQEFNHDSKNFSLIVSSSDSLSLNKVIDELSGDLIFYSIILQNCDSPLKCEIIAVLNPDYKFNKLLFNKDYHKEIFQNYTLIYCAEKDFDLMGNVVLSGVAYIQTKHESIYITSFSKTLDDPLETFPHAIGEFIKPIS